jgi:hypothetical protein
LATGQHNTYANPCTYTRADSKPHAQSEANAFTVANPNANAYANPDAYPRTKWKLRSALADWNLDHDRRSPLLRRAQLEGKSGRISDRRWLAAA